MHPEDSDPIENGRVYVAPPDLHLLVERGRVRLGRGPKENRPPAGGGSPFPQCDPGVRPPGGGVVLTGTRDDGSAGLRAVKRCGGVAIVQDPDDTLFPGMPESALRYADVDYCLPLDEIAPVLGRITREEAKEEGAYPVPDEMEIEAKVAGLDPEAIASDQRPGELSAFTCPECAGPLYEIQDGQLVRFRYRVGYAYTADSMLDEKFEALENALYVALNTLEESVAMTERLAARSREQEQEHAAKRFEERARDARQQAAVIRRVLTGGAAGAV